MTHRASYLVSLGEPNVYHESVCFTRIGDFTWRVSDCDELVGYSQEMRGSVMLSTNHLKAHSKFYQPHSQVIVQLKSNFFKLRNSWLT